ncbi:MAG TPA: ROK family protein [Reyranella sp.]|nr:ROK family protein [Reyranella sp.]
MRDDGGPHTLAIDIGGTGLKASVLDKHGHMVGDHVRVPTPKRRTPPILLDALEQLVAPLPPYDRVSIGFPGFVRDGRVITAPHLGTKDWKNFPLEKKLAERLGKPARLANDAEVQGLGIVSGHGLEVVLTLGTGLGSAVFVDGHMTPHLELAHHPIHKSQTYDEYVGDKARRSLGKKKWSRRVLKMIGIVETLLNYDILHLGGGNARDIIGKLPRNVRIESNDTGITGGIRLWDDAVWLSARSGGHKPG